MQQPDFAKKLHPISGDIQCEDLALQTADREFLIKNVSKAFEFISVSVRIICNSDFLFVTVFRLFIL